MQVASQIQVIPMAFYTQAVCIFATEHDPFSTQPPPDLVMHPVKNPAQSELVVNVIGAFAQILSTQFTPFQ